MKRYPNMTDEEYDSWRENLSKAHKGKKTWNTGKHLSEKHKENLSESHKGYVMSQEQKDKIGKCGKEYMNRPEIKKKYSDLGKKKFEDGTSKLVGIVNIRKLNARINEYDLTKSSWKILRSKIKERDNWTCQECKCDLHKRKSNCHHRIPYQMSKDNSEENLITLCIPCHGAVEYWTKKFFQENPKIPKSLNSLNLLKDYISEHMQGTI